MSPEYSTTQQDVVIRDHKRLDRYKKLMRFMLTVYTIYSSKHKKKTEKNTDVPVGTTLSKQNLRYKTFRSFWPLSDSAGLFENKNWLLKDL